MKSVSVDNDYDTWGIERAWGMDLEDWAILPSLILHMDWKWKDWSVQVQIGPFWARIGLWIWADKRADMMLAGIFPEDEEFNEEDYDDDDLGEDPGDIGC